MRRFEVRGYGPSNIAAASSEAVAADTRRSRRWRRRAPYAISQQVLAGFWTPAEALGAEFEAPLEPPTCRACSTSSWRRRQRG